jgi:hypothetical protein
MAKIFNGGMSCDPEIRLLNERFGVPAAGLIPYEEIEATISVARSNSRFHTVVERWRRLLRRSHNVIAHSEWDRGVGVRILADEERIRYGAELVARGGRNARRAVEVVGGVEIEKIEGEEKKAVARLVQMETLETARRLTQTQRRLADALRTKALRPVVAPPERVK